MTSHVLTLPQNLKLHDGQRDWYQSALLAGVLHLLALLGVASAAHFASSVDQNDLAAISASFESPSSAERSIQKTAASNKPLQSKPEVKTPQTNVPAAVSKPNVEQAVISTSASTVEAVATNPLTGTPTPVVAQAVPQPQKSTAPSATPAVVVSTPAIFDAAYLNNPSPRYPEVSRLRGEAGTTLLHVQISADGKALDVNMSQTSGSSKLDQAAVSAVLKWRFVSAKRAGIATSSWVSIPIEFSLNK